MDKGGEKKAQELQSKAIGKLDIHEFQYHKMESERVMADLKTSAT